MSTDMDFKDTGSSDEKYIDSETLPSAEIKDMKQISQAAANIARQGEQDEKRLTIFDRLASVNNGKYHFDEKRKLIETRFVAIPQAILHQYQGVQLKAFSGLLPLINRAYITIDNQLYLWNYYEGKTFVTYTKLTQVIISIALVKPKPGIFESEIKFVIVLATPVEVVMIGIAFTNDNVYGQITLYDTDFQVSSDNVSMLKIIGTPTGRIFMGGNDGNLYEFDYQNTEGYFTKKCRKINHSSYALTRTLLPSMFLPAAEPIVDIATDSSRSFPLLFTLSKSQSNVWAVQVFSLGSDGQGLTLLYRNANVLSECHALVKDPREKVTPDWDAKKFNIVTITPIPANQSDRVVLVALTQHGHRIFFSLEHEYPTFGVKGRDILKVRFIRLCPPAIALSKDRKSYVPPTAGVDPFFQQGASPRLVHQACYNDGVLLLADAREEQNDTLILIDREEHTSRSFNKLMENVESLAGGRPDPRVSGAGAFRSPLAPTTVVPHLRSRIFDIAEMAPTFYLTRDPVASCLFAKNSTRPLESLTEFAVQHSVPPRQFLVLTSNGIHYFKRQRPRDELREILKARHSTEDDTQLKLFWTKYGPSETISMCFLLACSESEIAEPGDPDARSEEYRGGSSFGDDIVKAQATQILFIYGHDRVQDDLRKGRAVAPSNRFSVLHEGLALYMSRLLRPVWNWSIVRPPTTPDAALRDLRFSKLQVLAFISPIAGLLKFLGKNRPQLEKFIAALPSSTEPDKGARFSLLGLIALLSLCQEVLHLLHMLCDTNFSKLTAMKTISPQNLKQHKFYALVTNKEGEEVVRSLIDALLQLTLSQPDQDAKINRLSDNCPTFFGKSELLYYQAMTWLAKGAYAKKSDERIKCFNQALKCYGKFAASPTFNIHEICQKLHAVHYYTGAIELALFRARLLESRDVVLESGLDEVPTTSILHEKDLCYECIFSTLDILVLGSYRIPTRLQIVPKTDTSSSTDAVDSSTGPLAPLDAVRLDEREAEAIKEKAFKLCLDNQDTLFQQKFYKWMIAKYSTQGIIYCKEKLLTVPAKQLVPFLTKEENLSHIELLKEYYLKNQMYEEATVLLCELAQKRNDGKEYYSLKDRIQFLSRALLCAQNCVDTVEENLSRGSKFPTIDSDTIARIKERIEIAKIQLNIQDALKAQISADEEKKGGQDKFADLDQLLELEDLAQVAEEFDLWEQWLAILNFSQPSHVRDIVSTLWQNIINTEILKSRKRRGEEKLREDEEREVIQDWQIRVHDKLVELSKLYGNNPTMFPRESITQHLTQCNEDHGDKDPSWVADCLRDCQSAAPRTMAR